MERVVAKLQERGFDVIAPANPLRELTSDSAYISSVLDTIEGPISMFASLSTTLRQAPRGVANEVLRPGSKRRRGNAESWSVGPEAERAGFEVQLGAVQRPYEEIRPPNAQQRRLQSEGASLLGGVLVGGVLVSCSSAADGPFK